MAASKKASPVVDAGDSAPKMRSQAMTASGRVNPRDGLGVYIDNPEANPEGRVVEYDDEFVVITDKFPKARQVQIGRVSSTS